MSAWRSAAAAIILRAVAIFAAGSPSAISICASATVHVVIADLPLLHAAAQERHDREQLLVWSRDTTRSRDVPDHEYHQKSQAYPAPPSLTSVPLMPHTQTRKVYHQIHVQNRSDRCADAQGRWSRAKCNMAAGAP